MSKPDQNLQEPYEARPLALIAIVIAVLLLLVRAPSDIFSSPRFMTFTTADDHVRLTRVLDFVQGRNGWFDNALHWSNSPFGTTIHWTRPLDAIVILLSAPFSIFLGWQDAVIIGGYLSAPVIYLSFLGTLWWAGYRLIGGGAASLAMIIVGPQPFIISYGGVGRVDHHVLLAIIFITLFGCAIRSAIVPPDDRLALFAGFIAALGIWISQEAIFGIVLLGGSWLVTWVLLGTHARALVWFTASWCCGLFVATFLEHGPSHWLRVEYDRVSRPHVLLAVAALIASIIILAANLRPWAQTKWRRLLITVISGTIAIALARVGGLDVIKLLGAPNSVIPDDIRTQWLEKLPEFVSIMDLNATQIVVYLGLPIASLILIARQAFRCRNAVWITFLLWQVSAIAAGVILLRSIIYAEAIGAIGVAAATWSWLQRVRGARRTVFLARPFIILCATLGPYLFAAALTPLDTTKVESESQGCAVQQFVHELEGRVVDQGLASGRPTAVLTHLDLAAVLHVSTGVDVVATGHHPNVDGIRTVRKLFRSPPETSRAEIERRNIRYILICEAIGTQFMTPMPTDSLYQSLVTDRPPSWLREIPIGSDGSWMYEVLI